MDAWVHERGRDRGRGRETVNDRQREEAGASITIKRNELGLKKRRIGVVKEELSAEKNEL